MGLCLRPLEPREAPGGRSPTTWPQGPLPPDTPDLLTFSSCPGELHARQGGWLPGEHSAQDQPQTQRGSGMTFLRPKIPVQLRLPGGKRKASALLLTWSIWSQRVTSPGPFRTSWLASVPWNSFRGGAGRQAVRGGLVSTWPVFGGGGGGGLAGPPAPPWASTAGSQQEVCRKAAVPDLPSTVTTGTSDLLAHDRVLTQAPPGEEVQQSASLWPGVNPSIHVKACAYNGYSHVAPVV